MNANELVTKAIREGIDYANEPRTVMSGWSTVDIDRMASTLSAGLVVLTEEEFTERIRTAWGVGYDDGTHELDCHGGYEYASSIMREVKGGE